MTPAERVASQTWHRLHWAHLFGARIGEETITDLLVLDMLPHQRMNAFSILHPTKREESRIGADLLVCIRYPSGFGRHLAVQAKKLYASGRYEALGHRDASGIWQIDKLGKFARTWCAVPVYLLYNHLGGKPCQRRHWHCCRTYDIEQLGCTLVPSWRIREAIESRGGRTFSKIHDCRFARPWRCVFDCDKPIEQVHSLALSQPVSHISKGQAHFRQEPLEWIQIESRAFDNLFEINEPLSIEDAFELFTRLVKPSEVDMEDRPLTYPRRVLAVDVDSSTKEPKTTAEA